VDPEDAAHDVFVLVLTRLPTLRNHESFEAWLFGITRRVLKTHRTAARRTRWWVWGHHEVVDPAPTADVLLSRSQVANKVQEALARLPRLQREVLILCDLEGRSAVQAAQVLGVSVGTIKSRLRLGRERLRRAPSVRILLAKMGQKVAG
jgi:RNA polymerase sigma-70 factor (ECF subfamily)